MKHIFTSFCLLFALNSFAQQVSKTIIVEHYTNTYCSICASKNPDLITNLGNNPDILHISYHPSVPYSQCPINQHNKSENDERTKFYNIFNGTPRIMIQGETGGSNFSSATLFDAYKNQMTSFSMTNTLEQDATKENLILKVTIKKEDASSLTELTLYSAIVEETLNFNASNGENVHHDVFRKSFVGQDPITVTLPVNVGESIELEYQMAYNSVWVGTELKAISILQNTDKTVEQSSESSILSGFVEPTVSIEENAMNPLNVYPTAFSNTFTFNLASSSKTFGVRLYDINGKLVYNNEKSSNRLDLTNENLSIGKYVLIVNDAGMVYSQKLVKTN